VKIGIISDTHNKEPWLLRALELLRDQGIRVLVHCGDLTDFSLCRHMRDFQVYYAFGNGDIASGAIALSLQQINPESRAGMTLDFTLAGKSFLVIHGNHAEPLKRALESETYDYVLRGHSHLFEDSRFGRTRLNKPGALGDWLKPHSFAVLDVEADSLTHYELKE
jgi:putative phosphoesterase